MRERTQGKKVLILGIGNPLRGDDGLGPALVEQLRGKTPYVLIDAGEVPENYLGPVEAAQANTIIMIDAARLGGAPGDLALLEIDQLAEAGISTHNASLDLFARLAQSITGADIFLLAVQPESTAFGAPLSPAVRKTVDLLAEYISSGFATPPTSQPEQPTQLTPFDGGLAQ